MADLYAGFVLADSNWANDSVDGARHHMTHGLGKTVFIGFTYSLWASITDKLTYIFAK
jgi:hypothetical protein